jgi:hypothetical protein
VLLERRRTPRAVTARSIEARIARSEQVFAGSPERPVFATADADRIRQPFNSIRKDGCSPARARRKPIPPVLVLQSREN